MPNRDREYRPGSSSSRFRKLHRGEYVRERMAWVSTLFGQAVLFFYEEGHEIADATNEPGPTVKVLIPRQKGPTLHWDLTALTEEELNALQEFFNLAFETAKPVVQMRDKAAQDALTEGNDSFTRVYRQVPQLVVRPRPERQHDQGVHDGPSHVPTGDESAGEEHGDAGRVRGSGGELADEGASSGGSQDDGPTAD